MELNSNTTNTLPRANRTRPDRPASVYDNLRGSGTLTNADESSTGGLGPNSTTCHASRMPAVQNGNPTQALCLNTTVPQNIAANAIAGRHTPTRNSLRHSRMIVLNRTGKVHRKHMPHVLRRYRLGRALAALQTLVGCAIATLAAWLLVWAPRLPTRHIPYWSGLPLLFSGILGLVLLCCCRKDYPGKPYNCHTFIFKVLSVIVSVLAGGACFCATAFGVLHLIFLKRATCEPTNILNSTCVCRSVTDSENVTDITAKVYRYSDLNCVEVQSLLSVLLIGSTAANFFGGLLIAWYLYLHWSSRYSYVYSQVRTNENKPIIISNKI